MVHRVALGIGRRMRHPFRRWQLIRGIGLDQQTVAGNGPEDGGLGGFAGMEGVARDAEPCAEADAFAHQFGRAAKAV